MDSAFWVRTGSGLMFLSVALGAFAAHSLKNVLSEELRAVFETGVRYQTYHALGLFAVAWLAHKSPSAALRAAGFCFLAGTLLFSGSLYALSLSGIRKFGAITPLGGLLFLIGWVLLLVAPYEGLGRG